MNGKGDCPKLYKMNIIRGFLIMVNKICSTEERGGEIFIALSVGLAKTFLYSLNPPFLKQQSHLQKKYEAINSEKIALGKTMLLIR